MAHLWADSTQRQADMTLSTMVPMAAEAEEVSAADIVEEVVEVVTLAAAATTRTTLPSLDLRRLPGSLRLLELLVLGWASRHLHQGIKVEEADGGRRPQGTMEATREALPRLPITMDVAAMTIATSEGIAERVRCSSRIQSFGNFDGI